MPKPLLFLSHTHIESELAILIKNNIEEEFSGFVEVFTSSDGSTIPAGYNFLKVVEQGLVNCVGGLYLISPYSVNKNWINFELGAVWIRNVISETQGGKHIPTVPICHSGMIKNQLPMPLTNLNSIQANEPSDLEFAFRSLQTALGGKGKLKTDFAQLAIQVAVFEKKYTIGDNLVKVFTLLKLTNSQIAGLLNGCKNLAPLTNVSMNCEFRSSTTIEAIKNLSENNLKGILTYDLTQHSIRMDNINGNVSGSNLVITINSSVLLQFEPLLLSKIR